jgi:hypothetical protein
MDFAFELNHHPRLGNLMILRHSFRLVHADEVTGRVTFDRELGMEEERDVESLADDLVGDRVNEEGHVVGDDLDDPVILAESPDERLTLVTGSSPGGHRGNLVEEMSMGAALLG